MSLAIMHKIRTFFIFFLAMFVCRVQTMDVHTVAIAHASMLAYVNYMIWKHYWFLAISLWNVKHPGVTMCIPILYPNEQSYHTSWLQQISNIYPHLERFFPLSFDKVMVVPNTLTKINLGRFSFIKFFTKYLFDPLTKIKQFDKR